MPKYSREEMQLRFWELTAVREKFFEDNAELYALRDQLAEEITPFDVAYKAAKVAVKDAERTVLPELDTERAMLARALGRNVGQRPDSV